MVYRKKSNCQKSASHFGQNSNHDLANLSIFKAAFEHNFFCLDFRKTVKSKRRQPGRPSHGPASAGHSFPGGQSPFRLHCFFGNPEKKKIPTHWWCMSSCGQFAILIKNCYSQDSSWTYFQSITHTHLIDITKLVVWCYGFMSGFVYSISSKIVHSSAVKRTDFKEIAELNDLYFPIVNIL